VRWGRAEAVAALAAALGTEKVPRVREAIMTALMRVGDEASVVALLPYLRSQDAGQRGTAIEALQALPETIMPFMPALLSDSDPDVRILATELARNMPGNDATRVLCDLLENELHPNVCAAAIDVLAEVGTRNSVPAFQACAARCNHPVPAVAVSPPSPGFQTPKPARGNSPPVRQISRRPRYAGGCAASREFLYR
jgi:HEAT repeat protein